METPPEGMQVTEFASTTAPHSHRSSISNRYDAPYDAVWDSVVRVVPELEKLGEMPVSRFDKPQGRVEVRETHVTREGPQSSMEDLSFKGWKDDFVIQVRRLSDTETKVTVHRIVRGLLSSTLGS